MKRQHEKQKELVIIGGGAGGCQTALMLAKVPLKNEHGDVLFDEEGKQIPKYLITILESQKHLLSGASLAAAQEHLGGEYPLSLATALDCLKAAVIKRLLMPESIYSKVPPKRFLIDFETDKQGKDRIDAVKKAKTPDQREVAEKEAATAITVEKFQDFYDEIRKAYATIVEKVAAAKHITSEVAEKLLFGSSKEGEFFRRLRPEEYADHKNIAGGFQTSEIGLNVAKYLTMIESAVCNTPNIEVITNCKVRKEGVKGEIGNFIITADQQQDSGTILERKFNASQVVQAAWQGGMAITPKKQAKKYDREVTVYKRGIMTLNLLPGWDKGGVFIMRDATIAGDGGMLSPYNDKIALAYVTSPNAAYYLEDKGGKTTLDARHPSLPSDWNDLVKNNPEWKDLYFEEVLRKFPQLVPNEYKDKLGKGPKVRAQALAELKDILKPHLIVRDTLNFHKVDTERQHANVEELGNPVAAAPIPKAAQLQVTEMNLERSEASIEEVEKGYFLLYPTKGTYSLNAALQAEAQIEWRDKDSQATISHPSDVEILDKILEHENFYKLDLKEPTSYEMLVFCARHPDLHYKTALDSWPEITNKSLGI